jgi:hypothetical protein
MRLLLSPATERPDLLAPIPVVVCSFLLPAPASPIMRARKRAGGEPPALGVSARKAA